MTDPAVPSANGLGPTPGNATHAYFFDNVRFALIFLVVVFHCAQSFGVADAGWYYVVSPQKSRFVDLFQVWTQVVIMPTFFFVSGYFAVSSFLRHGVRSAMRSKFAKIGIPYLVGLIIVIPPVHYLYALRPDQHHKLTFAEFWRARMIDSLHVRAEYWNDMYRFTPGPFWFLSFLLALFVLLAAFITIGGTDRFVRRQHPDPPGRILGTTLTVWAVVTASALACYLGQTSETAWFDIVPILEFQPTRAVIYIGVFALGVHAWRGRWFDDLSRLGRPMLWLLAVLVFTPPYFWAYHQVATVGSPDFAQKAIFTVLRCVAVFAYGGAIMVWAAHFWNRGNRVTRFLSEHSYNVYLDHIPFVVACQVFVIRYTHFPVAVKWALVSIATLVCAYFLAWALIARHPRVAVAGATAITLALAVTWR